MNTILNTASPIVDNLVPIDEVVAKIPQSSPVSLVDSDSGHFDVNEILEQSPIWITRWGITIIASILALLLLLSWFIHYPDTIQARVQLTSTNPPRSVIARTDGRITRLLVQEGNFVKAGQTIAYLESTANHQEVLKLIVQLGLAQQLLKQKRFAELNGLLLTDYHQLGELQGDYQTFTQAHQQLRNGMQDGLHTQKKVVLQQELSALETLHQNLLAQQMLYQQDVNLAVDEFKIHQRLAKEKVIAPLDFKREESKHLNRQMPYQQITSSLINNQLQQHSKKKEWLELNRLILEQRDMFAQALNTLQSAVYAWKGRYLLAAPTTGRIIWPTPLHEEQSVRIGQEVGFVVPEEKTGRSTYVGLMELGPFNFGKVKCGQTVLVKFPSYPSEEYGSLIGRVEAISPIASDTAFQLRISFPSGLRTTSGYVLPFRNGLTASGEILTDDKRLIDRLTGELKKLNSNRRL